jgi:2-dehydro-3-deoxyphosphogluconate aldolase/(4S)-4-hydroxy-2-oxoglutarate aldolase
MILSKKSANLGSCPSRFLARFDFLPGRRYRRAKANDYPALANAACAGGSWMVAPALLAAQDFGKVEPLAQEASALGRDH